MSKQHRLRVDWAACDGHGLCAVWAPEVIQRDEWGYPVVTPGPVPPAAMEHAREAVACCPLLALKLVPA
jgi:ferredoxin